MQRRQITLSTVHDTKLSALGKKLGLSRSETLRRAIDALWDAQPKPEDGDKK